MVAFVFCLSICVLEVSVKMHFTGFIFIFSYFKAAYSVTMNIFQFFLFSF